MSKISSFKQLATAGSALCAIAFAPMAVAQATDAASEASPEPAAAAEPEPVVTAEPVSVDQTVEEAFAVEAAQQAVVQPLPDTSLVRYWSVSNASVLLSVIESIDAEGLIPSDYAPDELTAAIAGGESAKLNEIASKAFVYLVEDLRDGRTPMKARKQWFVRDPDADIMPTHALLKRAVSNDEVVGTLASLMPTHSDYAQLKKALNETPAAETKKRAIIRANMDRWRWLPRKLGQQYLITNVPEYQLRLWAYGSIVRTFRTIVGKPGRNATPQLAENIEGVVYNPTWTVPQSIVKGEGLGAKVLGNPAWAKRAGYKATKGRNGWTTVVQQPGPGNSLGLMKLDMPNAHAIFLHDTPSRHLFKRTSRALSHGCIRTESALTLAFLLTILQTDKTEAQALAISNSGKYTKVRFKQKMPVYITYFTMGTDINGKLRSFNDIYGRDAPVLKSFQAPRVANRARVTSEEAVEIIDDLRT